jgi:hypothetical protein
MAIRTRFFALFLALVLCSSAISAQPALPLKISGNHRYLLDQNNRPVFLTGDSPWSLIPAVTKEDAERYLEHRRQQGFNALIVNLIEHKFNGPINREGEHPFTRPWDFATPNEKYFAHADWVLSRAAEKGIIILLAPMYLGTKTGDEGWHQEARLNGEAKCRDYGRYLGRRYKDYNNIIWLMGGDRNPADVRDEVDAVAAGIREIAPAHLFTAHTAPETTAYEQYSLSQWLDLNATYSYEIVHRKLLANYHHRPVMPNLLTESTYEGEHNSSPLQIRRQAYWALLAGATGQFYGNRPIWGFFTGWEKALDGPGGRDMANFAAFVNSKPWHALIPDDDHKVVTSGLGEFRGLDYLAAACTEDRRLLIAYIPTPRSVVVQLSALKGDRLRASWFDPASGKPSPAGQYVAQGEHEFRSPGDSDAVLVIEGAKPHNETQQ